MIKDYPSPNDTGLDANQPALEARATLHDVARLSGVSTATVARVLADSPQVKAQTRERVMNAVQRLNFHRNELARDLKRGTSSAAIGLVVGGFTNPFYMRVAAGAERELREAGYNLVLATTDYNAHREQAVTQAMLERRVSALLIATGTPSHGYLYRERALGTPVIFVNRPPLDIDADCVMFDERGAVRDATRSLLDAGHVTIAAIAGTQTKAPGVERLAGFIEALAERNVHVNEERLMRDVVGREAARKATRKLLNAAVRPTAFLALNQEITIGVAHELMQVKSPPALIGFDDFDLSEALNTTVIVRDAEELGKQAARMAISRLKTKSAKVDRLILAPTIIRRGIVA